VPVPGHEGHVIYVWIDALSNYYSATRRAVLAGAWDPDVEIVHLIGKEISRFHAVYWPAMLMAAGLRLPTTVYCHGWWTVDGEKMSKTAGNVVDPLKLSNDLGVDAFRYFVLREVPLGADGDFSHEALLTRYNAELANDLGNLLNRTLGMAHKYCAGKVPGSQSRELEAGASEALAAVERAMEDLAPSKALEALWGLVRHANTYIDQSAPWKQAPERQAEILWNVLEACRILSHGISPFMPERMEAMRAQLGLAEAPTWPSWRVGKGFEVPTGTPLFPRIDDDRKKELLSRWAPKRPEAAAPAAPVTDGVAQVSYEDFLKLDLRVGKIVAAQAVPKAKKLLQLTVDIGTAKKQVVAGIAETYGPEAIVGKTVIFLANLKPATIRGVLSEGMILAAGEEQVVALSGLDRDAAPGTKVR
jgi:methionyl-tRNA synthetase